MGPAFVMSKSHSGGAIVFWVMRSLLRTLVGICVQCVPETIGEQDRYGSGARLGLLDAVAALVLALTGVATWPTRAEDAGATSESAA
nr:hypothetical protein CE91St29_21750 [Corynebacterium striatum]